MMSILRPLGYKYMEEVVRVCLANRLLAVAEFENHVYPSQLEATMATVSKIDAKLNKVTRKRG